MASRESAEALDAVEEALGGLGGLTGEEMGEVSDWLDAVFSTLHSLPLLSGVEAGTLYTLVRGCKRVKGAEKLFHARKSVRLLEKYADAFDYGVCTWSEEKIAGAEDARVNLVLLIREFVEKCRDS